MLGKATWRHAGASRKIVDHKTGGSGQHTSACRPDATRHPMRRLMLRRPDGLPAHCAEGPRAHQRTYVRDFGATLPFEDGERTTLVV